MPYSPTLFDNQELLQIFDHLNVEIHVWKIVRDDLGQIVNWRLVYINPLTLQTWGFDSVAGLIGKTTDEIFGAGASDHYLAVVKKIIDEEQPYSYRDYFPHLDKHFRFTSIPFGEFFITTGDDISDFVKDEEIARAEISALDRQIRDSKEQLQMSREALRLQQLVQAEKDKIFRATLFGAQHIIYNLLNQLQIIDLEIERHPAFDTFVIATLNEIRREAKELIEKLSTVEEVEDVAIMEAVKPHRDGDA